MQKDLKTLESMNQAAWYNHWLIKKFAEYINGDILEVGCGIGNFTKSLSRYKNVYAIDINPYCIKTTAQIVHDTVKVGFGDIEKNKYFFKDKGFDTIICINVLEHIMNDHQAIKNLTAMLKKGGYLILIVPGHQFLYSKIDKEIGHFRRYQKKDLIQTILKNKLKLVKSRRLNFVGSIGWFIAGKIFHNSYIQRNKIKIFNLIAPIILPFESIIESPIGISILIVAKK